MQGRLRAHTHVLGRRVRQRVVEEEDGAGLGIEDGLCAVQGVVLRVGREWQDARRAPASARIVGRLQVDFLWRGIAVADLPALGECQQHAVADIQQARGAVHDAHS